MGSYEIPAFSLNAVKRISLKSKGHISDTGLACTAMVISTGEALAGHPHWGYLFESAIISELRKQTRLLRPAPTFYHWRSQGGCRSCSHYRV